MTSRAKPKSAPLPELQPASPFVPPSINDAKELMDKLIQEELRLYWSEPQIKLRVKQTIENHFNHIVRISLGFSKTAYNGDWEVDHCNGRGGNTEVTAQISAIAKDELAKAISNGIKEGKFTLGTKELNALQRQFQEYVSGYEARKQIEELARRRVGRLVATLEGDLTGADE